MSPEDQKIIDNNPAGTSAYELLELGLSTPGYEELLAQADKANDPANQASKVYGQNNNGGDQENGGANDNNGGDIGSDNKGADNDGTGTFETNVVTDNEPGRRAARGRKPAVKVDPVRADIAKQLDETIDAKPRSAPAIAPLAKAQAPAPAARPQQPALTAPAARQLPKGDVIIKNKHTGVERVMAEFAAKNLVKTNPTGFEILTKNTAEDGTK